MVMLIVAHATQTKSTHRLFGAIVINIMASFRLKKFLNQRVFTTL